MRKYTNKDKIQKLAKKIKKEIPVLHIVEATTLARKYYKGGSLYDIMKWFEDRGGKISELKDSNYCETCSCFRGYCYMEFRKKKLEIDVDCCGPIILKFRKAYIDVFGDF